jgi:cell division protein FtsZ
MGILTVAVVTRPFLFEGKVRDKNARKGIDDLRRTVDTIIVIPNQKLLSIVDRTTSLIDAFKTADDVLYQATKGISDLISVHGLVNLDFADVKTIMKGMGDALMGTGYAEGENRAAMAADSAIHSPLLDEISINGARGILINITGGDDMTLYDVSDATQTVYDAVGEEAETNIIFGAVTDPAMNGKIRVTVIATGFNETTIEKKIENNSASKLLVKMPNQKKNEAEKPVEQMSFPLTMPGKKEANPDAIIPEEPRIIEYVNKTPESPNANVSSGIDIPSIMRNRDPKSGVERVYVSKGSVITQYEDDMDVPTFLRKQMQ